MSKKGYIAYLEKQIKGRDNMISHLQERLTEPRIRNNLKGPYITANSDGAIYYFCPTCKFNKGLAYSPTTRNILDAWDEHSASGCKEREEETV